MGIRNPDGSTAEMCGNGIRTFLKYVRDRGLTDRDQISVETLAGESSIPRWLGDDQVEIEMTRPVLEPQKIPTTLGTEGSAGRRAPRRRRRDAERPRWSRWATRTA